MRTVPTSRSARLAAAVLAGLTPATAAPFGRGRSVVVLDHRGGAARTSPLAAPTAR